MDNNNFAQITKYYSTSFYWASLLFPKETRNDVYALYAFLRYSDELADTIKDVALFENFRQKVLKNLNNSVPTGDKYIDSFRVIYNKYDFNPVWIKDFFNTLEMDLKDQINIKTYKDLEKYIYGVADVVGLMMAKIMRLSDNASHHARLLGKGMQMVNIIRDIKEDYQMKRIYIPADDIAKFKIKHIYPLHENFDKQKFEKLVRFQIDRAIAILHEAKKGLNMIPPQYRKPILISLSLYLALANKIYSDPMKIWDAKIKLSKIKFFGILTSRILYEF